MAGPHIVVVGASLGGLRAVESIRALGICSSITVVGEEAYMPYNRPPLSKEFLKADACAGVAESLFFRMRPNLEDVTWRLGHRAQAVDLTRKRLTLSDHSTVAFDAMVVATGLRPRRLAITGARQYRFACRTVDDAISIRNNLQPGLKVVLVGGGFIGCELAATLSELGVSVTVIEPFGLPMERALGADMAQAFSRLHTSRGVSFRLGKSVSEIAETKRGTIEHVLLDDGECIQADLMVEAVGSHANVEWLEGNDLDLSDGVLCDRDMRVGGLANIVAVGDVARFPNAFVDGIPRRTEHWCVPAQTAKRAAGSLAEWTGAKLERPDRFAPIPSFWSDQFGVRIQAYGSPIGVERWEVVEGSLSGETSPIGAVVAGFVGDRMSYAVAAGVPATTAIKYQGLVARYEPMQDRR